MDVDEALNDLRLIKRLLSDARRGATTGGAPFFALWGAIWVVGYLLPAVGTPSGRVGPLWLGLDAVGALASAWIGVHLGRSHGPVPYLVRKWFWSGLILLGFGLGALLLAARGQLAPPGPAFFVWPLAVGTWYAVGGLMFDAPVFLALGLWIAAVSVAAPFLAVSPALQQALVGVLAGGATMVTGLGGLRRREGRG